MDSSVLVFSMGLAIELVLALTLIALSRAVSVKEALNYSDNNVKDLDADLLQLAAIPSISSLPEHAKDIVAASEWLIEKLKASGLEVKSITSLPVATTDYSRECTCVLRGYVRPT